MVRITTIEEHEDNVIAIMARMSRTIGHVDIRVGNRLCEISAKDAIAIGNEIVELGTAAQELMPKTEAVISIENASVISSDGTTTEVIDKTKGDDEPELTIG